ncbi:LAME_0H10660g1_1 [Lachancea meyersii CBS 8951]|uniref:LAME_0H10660g1_1 n=1 Tax=Lachancea meyersii CBS 8951 TaxID=1266667 RepID=A0A1G4KGA8_9SACH|nr:LAME_0H10660g1_1 [Lachancea meyersii CBS 8951]
MRHVTSGILKSIFVKFSSLRSQHDGFILTVKNSEMGPRNKPMRQFGASLARDENKESARGLNVEIHPALLSENVNLIKYRNNPYLSHEGQGKGLGGSKVAKRYSRGLKFHEPGVLSRELDEQRAFLASQNELKRQQEEIERAKVRAGELPDVSIREHNYLLGHVPQLEWWDAAYVGDVHTWSIKDKYTQKMEDSDDDDDEDDYENENNTGTPQTPTIRYVQHPVPIKTPDLARELPVPRIRLVKREQKKVRRNRRKLLREEHEHKVQLGLEPKPAPKVKLANMMSVYQNSENITDPTSWEQTVRAQVEDRHRVHVETNIRRHLEAKEHKKEANVNENTASTFSDLHCRVFRFSSLRNPKIRFKLAANSRQLKMRGVCLRAGCDGPGILIVVGTEKNCRFYLKLVLHRLKWSEGFTDPDTGLLVDCSKEKVTLEWEGILKECRFRGWFMKECQSEDEIREVLRQLGSESFYDVLGHR